MKLEKRLIYIGGGLIALIILIVLIVWVTSLFKSNKLSYEGIEKEMVSAATSYTKSKKETLPTENGTKKDISVAELVSAKKMKELSEYLGKDSKVSCSGKVTIYYTNNVYKYTPYLDCGDNYKTTFFYEVITSTTVTELDGLYKIETKKAITSDESKETEEEVKTPIEVESKISYIYRGENINNYVLLSGIRWRIVEVTEDGNILLVQVKAPDNVVWDDRYNIEFNADEGINDYLISRVKNYLERLYEDETYYESDIRELILPQTLCVQALSPTEKVAEVNEKICNKVLENQYLGLLSANYYLNASLDSNCVNITDYSCSNYNYLSSQGPWWSITASSKDSVSAFYATESALATSKANRSRKVRPTVLIGNYARYVSGSGTESDPYILK